MDGKRAAITMLVDHGAAHAKLGARIEPSFKPKNRGLRAEIGIARQPDGRQLKHRIGPRPVGLVAILFTGGVGQPVMWMILSTPCCTDPGERGWRIQAARCCATPHRQIQLAQGQKVPNGGHRAVQPRHDRPRAERRQAWRRGVIFGGNGVVDSGSVGDLDTPSLR